MSSPAAETATPLHVVAFTAGETVPSSRFRVRQFVPELRARGVTVDEHWSSPGKYDPVPFGMPKFLYDRKRLASREAHFEAAARADIVWLEREFLFGRRTLEHRAGTAATRVFDVDDAIFLSGEKGFSEAIASECAAVIAGNAWLAEHYRPHAKRVYVVPTAVDPSVWAGGDPTPDDPRFVVGWTGTSANFQYLLETEEALAEFLGRHADAVVRVVADRAPAWKKLPPRQTEFVKWTVADERLAVRGMDAGLMPLADEPWAKGKCAAKMLVYMAAAVPPVVSPVGVNADVLAQGDVGLAARSSAEWAAALERLYADREGARAMGLRGLDVVNRAYSVAVNAARIAEIFREVRGAIRP